MKTLQDAVKKELDSGRIGTPVFVRSIAQVDSNPKNPKGLKVSMDELLNITHSWLKASPEKIYTQGSAEAGQITATVKYADGRSALLSLSSTSPEKIPKVDLLVLGNKGAIYHDEFPAFTSIEPKFDSMATSSTSLGSKTEDRARQSRPYGILLAAGLRTHQEGYAQLFASDQRCRLIAVTDELNVPPRRAKWNRKFAEKMNLPYIPDLDLALARDDVDIVSICVEHERRRQVAVKCAQAGKHIYLDKPMACSISDAKAIVEAVKKSGIRSQVFSFIHYPWAKLAKQALQSGIIGELIAIHADILFAKGYTGTAPLGSPRKQEPNPTRFTFIDSKRELRATGVYAMGLVKWLTQSEVKTVFGLTANYFFAEHVKNDVEDFGLITMMLDDGVTATITGGRIGWMSHPNAGPNRIYLIGTKGALKIDAYQPRLEVYANEPAWTPPPVNPEDPMGFWQSTQREVDTQPKRIWIPLSGSSGSSNDASKFIDYIESGFESEMSAKEGAKVVEVLMAGYVSASKGEAIEVISIS